MDMEQIRLLARLDDLEHRLRTQHARLDHHGAGLDYLFRQLPQDRKPGRARRIPPVQGGNPEPPLWVRMLNIFGMGPAASSPAGPPEPPPQPPSSGASVSPDPSWAAGARSEENGSGQDR